MDEAEQRTILEGIARDEPCYPRAKFAEFCAGLPA